MPLGMEVGLGPGHIVLDGDPAVPPPKGVQPPNFWPMSVVAKRSLVLARPTAEHLLIKPSVSCLCVLEYRPTGVKEPAYKEQHSSIRCLLLDEEMMKLMGDSPSLRAVL